MLVPNPDAHAHEGSDLDREALESGRLHVSHEVTGSQRFLQPAEVPEDLQPQRVGQHLFGLSIGQTGDHQVLRIPVLIMCYERRVAGAGQQPGTVRDFLEDGVEFEVLADPQDRLGQPVEATAKGFVLGT